MSATEFDLCDLRQQRDPELLRRVYDELYLPTFIDPDEQETFEQYRSRLFDAQLPPPQPVTHFVVAGRNLHDASEAELLGFIIFETYRESGCGLLTYLVTAPAARGQGLGRRLIAEAQATLRNDVQERGGTLRAIFAEMHDPSLVTATEDVIDPHVRLEIMRRLGAARIPIHYVQPELYPGGERSRQLFLTTFPLGGGALVASLPVNAASEFLHEFYRALGVAAPESDADYQSMCAELGAAVDRPPKLATSPLPIVRLVKSED